MKTRIIKRTHINRKKICGPGIKKIIEIPTNVNFAMVILQLLQALKYTKRIIVSQK